jgi:hypothetical protein
MLILLFALAIIPVAAGQAPGTGASAIPDHVTLTWTGDPSKTMTITWRTDPTVRRGLVQYREGTKLSRKVKQAKANARDFVTDLGPIRLFSATLVNLSPNKKYSYRVGDGEHWSSASFSTADESAWFNFLSLATAKRLSVIPTLWRNSAEGHKKPDAKFMVNMGVS